jgi:hypothetical protein
MDPMLNPKPYCLQDYMDPLHPRKSFFSNVKHMFDLSDVVDDMTLVR